MKRKGLILFLAITLTTVFMPAEAMQIYGASAINYNSSDALSYAKNHWNDGKGDCVAFVRKCVESGGIPRDNNRGYNYTAKQYKDYLVKKGYAVVYKLQTAVYYDDYYGIKADDNKGKIAAGDIILYRCNNKKCPKPDFHLSICNGAKGTAQGKYPGWMTCYAHNTAVNNKVACKIRCSKCGASKNSISLYAIHFKSSENGYSVYNGKVLGVKAKESSDKSITVSWKKLSTASGYKVYRATSKSGTYSYIASTTKTKYTDTVKIAGKKYYYKIKPYKKVNGLENLGIYSAVVFARSK